MRKLFSACASLLSLATMPAVGIAQSGSKQISITPTSSQKVIAGAPDRFTGSVRVPVSLRREGTSPVERWPGQVPARSAIGLAYPSAWPDLDRHRWCRLGSAMGRPCSGDSQGRRRLDSGWRQALAWCNAHHHHDAHRVSGATGRQSGGLVGKGPRRAVPACEVRESKNKKGRRSS